MSTATGSSTFKDGEIPPLRHRRSGKLASIQEDSTTPPPGSRRASSFFSESSFDDARQSFRSSTDDLLLPRAVGDEEELHQDPNLWYSLPLLVAIFPAIGGIAFKQGALVITDLLLLILTAFFLHYCLVAPWIWYHAAQTIRITRSSVVDNVVEEDDDDEQREWAVETPRNENPDGEPRDQEESRPQEQRHDFERDAALNELKRHEMVAFATCFAGPLVGAYILHTTRSSLSHFHGDLVSNLHLTIFVLGAEIRPLRHLMKMVQGRTMYLQRLVREDPHMPKKVDATQMQDLGKRLDELETAFADGKPNGSAPLDSTTASTVESLQKGQKVLQSQIDALNRAVRRYEKRATAHSMHTEARLHDVESRISDALSLAAAANRSQQPGMINATINSFKSLVMLPLDALWTAIAYPLRLLNAAFLAILVRLGLAQTSRRRGKQPIYGRGIRERPQARTKK